MDVDAWVVAAGLVVGVLYGVFGVGSAFATPVLSLLGVPGLVAVVAPLPALLPSSMAGAWSYARADRIDWPLARRAVTGAFPAAVVGALVSRWVDGGALLVLSGLALLVAGARLALPHLRVDVGRAARWGAQSRRIVAVAAVIGFASGLLANGGGFLLVPLFLLVLGLDMNAATGTSLLVAVALTIPTLVVHVALGDVDWSIAGLFAVGLAPGAFLGGHVAQRLPATKLRCTFGVLLIGFAAWYLARQLGIVAV